MKAADIREVIGGDESQMVVGLNPFPVQNNMRSFALTVRVTGTVIAAIQVQPEGCAAQAYVPTWLGVALTRGDYFISRYPIVSITLTAVGDSVILHCNRPY